MSPRRLGWLNLVLDGVAVAFLLAVFAQAHDPDVLFHLIWVVLTFEAFLFGLRATSVRIAVTMVAMVGYILIANFDGSIVPVELVDLELSEWPLMLIIIVAVAVMADRVSSTSRRYANLYRQASNRLLTAQEDERKRLALDLHDGVGQVLTALSLTLDAVDPVNPTSTRRSARALGRAKELGRIAIAETRGVASELRPVRIRENGLVPSLRELIRTSGMPVEILAEAEVASPGLLPADVEVEVFRIVQESIANVQRHAHARKVRLEVRSVAAGMLIELTDDGSGFDPRLVRDAGLGLAGMRERARAVAADLVVASQPGRGTTVRLTVPLGEPAKEAAERFELEQAAQA